MIPWLHCATSESEHKAPIFTAIFSIAESILWKPFPYPQSERLVAVHARSAAKSRSLDLLTVPEYLNWKSNNTTLEELAAFRWTEGHVLKAGANLARVDFPPSMVGDRVTRGLRTIGRSRRFLPRKPHDAR